MKVSLKLAQFYSNVDLKSIPKDTLIQKAGAQIGGIEEVIDWSAKYDGVLIAKVVSCEDHPGADRLHVCMVDDGGKATGVDRNEHGHVQVVCGAPNVRAGMYVAWLPPGTTVPASFGTADQFVLGKRELRGVMSNGMLASAHELGMSDDHDGILEILPEEIGSTPKPGEPLLDYYGLNDYVIDFENKMFTHRPDCFGIIGVARELAGTHGLAFKSPSWYTRQANFATASSVKLTVKNEAKEKVPRLMAVAMNNVTVRKSPIWLQVALSKLGMKPINNVVDITNFVMHVLGQPMHAYDADKLGNTLISRMAKSGEKIALLNGKEIELTADDIVIATNDRVVGLAGIMGGAETEVDESTKNIIIECATFDMYTIRRSSMHHGIFTDASTRYTKGQSPLQNPVALWFAMNNLEELAGAEQASSVADVHGRLNQPEDVAVTAAFINERLGSNISLQEISKLLENVEFTILKVPADKNRLHVRPPFWRTDIQEPEDIVEEIGRLYGYDKIPVTLPARLSKPAKRNEDMDLKQSLRSVLSSAGANEVLTYSFVHGDLMRKTGSDPEKWAYHIRNAISPELQYYRTALLPSLLDKVRGNIRADIIRTDDNDFAIFEFGKIHVKGHETEENVPKEYERLAFVIAADAKTAARKYDGSAYYLAKYYLEALIKLPLTFVPIEINDEPHISSYQSGRSAGVKLRDQELGVVGELSQSVKQALKLPDYCAGFEIDLAIVKNNMRHTSYAAMSQYPKIQQDITFETNGATSYAKLVEVIESELAHAKETQGIDAVLHSRDIYQADNSDKKRVTFRVWLSHPGKTLTTEETNTLLDAIAAKYKVMDLAIRI